MICNRRRRNDATMTQSHIGLSATAERGCDTIKSVLFEAIYIWKYFRKIRPRLKRVNFTLKETMIYNTFGTSEALLHLKVNSVRTKQQTIEAN